MMFRMPTIQDESDAKTATDTMPQVSVSLPVPVAPAAATAPGSSVVVHITLAAPVAAVAPTPMLPASPATPPANGNGKTNPVKEVDPPAEQNGPIEEQPAGTASEAPKTPPPHKNRLLIIFLSSAAVLFVGIAIGVYYFFYVAPYESTDDAYIDGHVISINPQVSALVASIHIDDNVYVHKGDLLIELDLTDYQVALSQKRGAEASAKGKLEQAHAGVDAAVSAVAEARAEVDSVLAKLENADLNLKHYEGLDAQARSQQDLDTATANRKTAAAAVEQANAQLQAAQSQVTSAKANVIAADGDYQKAQADTLQAQVNLGYCRIVAPCDGKVTNKNVDPGDYVTSATQLFQLVRDDVWVTANFKETQLNEMRPGQPVTLTVDAYPKMAIHGKVDSIQAGSGSRFSIIPAENATGNFVKIVQRVPVKITLEGDLDADPKRLLSPGMSVDPEVRVH